MNVAFLLVDPFPVLSETFILNQVTGLLDRGHDVQIFARRPAAGPMHPDVARYGLAARTVYWPELGAGASARALRGALLFARHATALPALTRTLDVPRFGRAARSLNLLAWAVPFAPRRTFDAIVCHFGWSGRAAAMLEEAGVLCGPIAIFFHGADMSLREETAPGAYARLFARGALFLPVSRHWRAKLVAMGCPAERTCVHRMGIDSRRFAMRERRLDAGAPVRLVSVSRLVEKKGIEYGIRAVAMLLERGRDVRYEIVGDGPLRATLERLIAGLGVTDRVTLRGWLAQDEVLRVYERSHLTIAPSITGANGDQEGIPVALMEAMALGMPVVSTFHSGIPELVEDGVSGRLVPERDVQALAGAIEALMDAPGQWAAMGRAGRRRVEEAFDVDRLNDELVERLEALRRDA